MNVRLLVTTLSCLLALGGCITVSEPLADSDASMGDTDSDAVLHEGVGGAAGGFAHEGTAGGAAGAAGGFEHEGTGGGVAGAAGGFETGGVGGGVAGAAGGFEGEGTGGGAAGAAGGFETGGFGGGVAGAEGGFATGGVGGGVAGAGGAAGGGAPELATRSTGCQLVEDEELCMGEGWRLAADEPLPGCGESGAYRICTFDAGSCDSHTVMMVQRCGE